MSYYSVTQQNSPSAPPAILQAGFSLIGGLALFLFSLLVFGLGYDMAHAGQIYPGVSVAGIDLAGLGPVQAAALLSERLNYPETGKIVFRDGSKVWMTKPNELGLYLDLENTALAAYQLGRTGNPLGRAFAKLESWYTGKDLPPLLVYDQRVARQYLESLAAQVNIATIEATLQVEGVNVVAQPGQVGRSLDIDATLLPLQPQIVDMSDAILPLVIHETPPGILDVSAQADTARKILSAPLVLSVPDAKEGDPGPWTLEPERLARILVVQRIDEAQGSSYQVGLDAAALRTYLESVAGSVTRSPQNARFSFDDDARQLVLLKSATIGRSLDVEATIQTINQRLAQGEHQVPLTVNYSQPAVPDDATAESLGIRDLVSKQTTYFYGSTGPRLQNIETAASRFNGVLVPPGAVFSMADIMGDVSLDSGYAEALIIYGNRTIEGVGGGVCQVSTTLFRTVFFGGYPVVERHSHAYRVGYYELNAGGGYDTEMAGLDATVYVPVVDFKFKNDSQSWLLMETDINIKARTLTWKFYSTSDGRSVEWDTSGLNNITEPPEPTYVENLELGNGEIRQLDWAVQGADVTITRVVMLNGQVFFQDQFSTHYLPWGDIFEYGPGTELPNQDEEDQNSN